MICLSLTFTSATDLISLAIHLAVVLVLIGVASLKMLRCHLYKLDWDETCSSIDESDFRYVNIISRWQPWRHFIKKAGQTVFTVQSVVLRLHVVSPSVTLVDQHLIGWQSRKLIAQTISQAPFLFVAKRPSAYFQGNIVRNFGDTRGVYICQSNAEKTVALFFWT